MTTAIHPTEFSFLLTPRTRIWSNLSPAELIEQALLRKEGVLSNTGALMVDTGKFTGRSPDDKFWVEDEITLPNLWWGEVNHPTSLAVFEGLKSKMEAFIVGKDLFVQDVFACADPSYQYKIRVLSSHAYSALFARNMLIVPDTESLKQFSPDYQILCIPEFEANPDVDGIPHANFTIINMTQKLILIGGSGYTGEIKKGIFSILNFHLPLERNTLAMHCSANSGEHGDTAIFFGLSGTGKTTLSTDPNRKLIGDDEHGWSPKGVFNFEGGCYAKVVNLSETDEPDIFHAIRFGALLENTRFVPSSRNVDYKNDSVTPNTRVSYPLNYIQNALIPSMGGIPKNIFFLTADAWGVLPPISKLNPEQAMFYFINGYTSKLAGTEMGIIDPKMVFSACFGAPFMPLHPRVYAQLLAEKIQKYQVNVWLLNTGWSGGAYGTGQRIKIPFTRSMIKAALDGQLNQAVYHQDPHFGVMVPGSCPGVPYEILDPIHTWTNADEFTEKAKHLADAFKENFKKYANGDKDPIWAGAPA